jgi:hypothetical protein
MRICRFLIQLNINGLKFETRFSHVLISTATKTIAITSFILAGDSVS